MNNKPAKQPGEDLTQLISKHPDLPIYKMGKSYYGETDDCFVLELTGACIGEWWEHETMVFDDRDDVVDLLMSDGDMSEREAEATVDSLPHGECIWLLMDYAPL